MLQAYKTIQTGGQSEISVKKSRFIANVSHVDTQEEAIAYIEKIKKQNYDAKHHCFAFSVGIDQPTPRFSDDGEPSGTAGKPILEVIEGQDLHNLVIVVTRYFGGTLLGTGGLVRAYTDAAKEGLLASDIIKKIRATQTTITTNYNDIGKLQYLLGTENIPIISSDYTDVVTLNLLIPVDRVTEIKNKIIETTAARATIEEGDTDYFDIA